MAQRPSDSEDLRLWASVESYYEERVLPPDAVLEAALVESRKAGLPDIQVSRLQGKFLYLLALVIRAQRILEIGTLGGYSTIWLARSLPPYGRLVSLELEPNHAELARANLRRAHLESVVEIRVGSALDTLPRLETDGIAPFDLTFVDADKTAYPEYLDWAIRLSRKGGVIVVDNVVRRGDVPDGTLTDANVQGVRRMADRIAKDRRISATVLQTVGPKGYDGMFLAVVGSPAR